MSRGKPDLPEVGFEWPEPTVHWWSVWVASPVTDSWTPLEWQYLADTALVHATVWGSGDATKLPELRARVERLGGLPAIPKDNRVSSVITPAAAERKESPLDELSRRRAERSAGA